MTDFNPYTDMGQIEAEPEALKIFNGIYTIENSDGEHRTFRIKTQAKDATFAPGARVVSLLTGSDNGRDYKGFAFVRKDESGFSLWKKYIGIHDETTIWEWYARLLWSLASDPQSPYLEKGYKILRESRCIKCNRRLTTPDSIKFGIGPECRKIR